MGLSGATKKQRIQDDPRNLRWAQDTSAPGFKLLASMGWDPSSNPSLGNHDSQAAIMANGGSAFSKKISSIPIAKEDNLGIGMKRGTAANVVGSLKAIGVPSSFANSTAKVSGFVTAGSGSNTPNGGGQGSSQGGEFGGLLARLNKMKEQGSLVATPITSDSESAVKKRKRSTDSDSDSSSSSEDSSSDDSDSDSDDESKSKTAPTLFPPVPSTSASASPAPVSSFAAAMLKNPRMAARSKHLRAKRMAAGNASAMAEILGLAPTPSPSSSGASTPALAIAPPSSNGWPVAPPAGSSAIVKTTTVTINTTEGEESEKEKRKREKAEKKLRKAEKAARKALKEEKKKATTTATVARPRSPSPEFKVHSAQHDPFHVTDSTPTIDPTTTGPAKKATGIYASMFVSSKQGGMGATWTPPTENQPGTLKEEEEVAAVTVTPDAETIEKKSKKSKKEKKDKSEKKDKKSKSKKRKADESVEMEAGVEANGGAEVTEKVKETKEEKRARKEAKRAKKEAKKTKE
ncbi:uncharacterized protein JCM6883_004357 [Sporobolomyces salmoneus]|uniref:uncharacterized protein n=1 Tax=Sporobolomyces salmoneus TaxID=183962 RepID=UPI003170FFC8